MKAQALKPKLPIIAVTALVIVLAAIVISISNSNASTPNKSLEAESGSISGGIASIISDSGASGGKAIKFGGGESSSCVVSAKLVNPCRPWLGAYVQGYSQADSDTKSQILYHEQRIGRQLDVVHTYHPPGSNQLSSIDIYFATRPNTILLTNWKPTTNWASADGSNATVNASIDQMADSIKALAPHKIMLAIFHEPENDVSPGGDPNCPDLTYKGSDGTVADYRAMWANVESRFAADGVTNVVWVMNYMGFSNWNCLIKDMWPGNDLVDWVTWDPYVTYSPETIDQAVSSFYDFLTDNSDSSHNFLSKPWGLSEWGMTDSLSESEKLSVFSDMKADLDSNTYPKLKMLDFFDVLKSDGDDRIGCVNNTNPTCTIDQTKQDAYNALANDPNISGSFTGLP